jgi:hypothetical protein
LDTLIQAPKKPIRLYKFLNRRYADDMMRRGLIRVGTAVEYRVPDGRTGARSDDDELKRSWQPGDVTISMGPDHPFIQGLYKGNPPWKGPVQIIFDPASALISVATAWIYSASLQLSDALRKRMAADFDADACIRIDDAAEFAKGIAAHEKFSKFPYYGNNVHYVASYDTKEHSGIDPFTKLNKYRWQKEFRLVWTDDNARDGIVIEVPPITSLLRRMY